MISLIKFHQDYEDLIVTLLTVNGKVVGVLTSSMVMAEIDGEWKPVRTMPVLSHNRIELQAGNIQTGTSVDAIREVIENDDDLELIEIRDIPYHLPSDELD